MLEGLEGAAGFEDSSPKEDKTGSGAPPSPFSLGAPLSGPSEYSTPAEVEDLAGNWVDVEWWVANVRAWLSFSFERRRVTFGGIPRAMEA
ncbi:hypothetical protein K0M31_007496, partial [Melipona bicolor]